MAQPFCRYCGKAIAKKTRMVIFVSTEIDRRRQQAMAAYWTFIEGNPETKADAQRLVNQQVVSVKRGADGRVSQVSTWDGESYEDPYFCNGTHAKDFAYAAARTRPGLAMPEYHAAVAAAAAPPEERP